MVETIDSSASCWSLTLIVSVQAWAPSPAGSRPASKHWTIYVFVYIHTLEHLTHFYCIVRRRSTTLDVRLCSSMFVVDRRWSLILFMLSCYSVIHSFCDFVYTLHYFVYHMTPYYLYISSWLLANRYFIIILFTWLCYSCLNQGNWVCDTVSKARQHLYKGSKWLLARVEIYALHLRNSQGRRERQPRLFTRFT